MFQLKKQQRVEKIENLSWMVRKDLEVGCRGLFQLTTSSVALRDWGTPLNRDSNTVPEKCKFGALPLH
jgi:hypothetical protein